MEQLELPPRAISLHALLLLLLSLLFLFIAAGASTATAPVAAADTVVAPSSAAAPSPRPSSPTTQSTTTAAFLRARCATTLYPAVCYDSLLPYASTFRTSRVRLARAAADVAAARIRDLSARLEDLRRREREHDPGVAGGPRGTAALEDCTSTVPAAAGLARRSSAELARLAADEEEGGSSPSSSAATRRRWPISNAQTWLSTAMSNEETCADGFADAGEPATGSPAGKLAAAGVASVRQYTSNALALVNGIPL